MRVLITEHSEYEVLSIDQLDGFTDVVETIEGDGSLTDKTAYVAYHITNHFTALIKSQKLFVFDDNGSLILEGSV